MMATVYYALSMCLAHSITWNPHGHSGGCLLKGCDEALPWPSERCRQQRWLEHKGTAAAFPRQNSQLPACLEDTFYKRIELFCDQWVVNICGKVKQWLIRSPRMGQWVPEMTTDSESSSFTFLDADSVFGTEWVFTDHTRGGLLRWYSGRESACQHEIQETWVQSELGRSLEKK